MDLLREKREENEEPGEELHLSEEMNENVTKESTSEVTAEQNVQEIVALEEAKPDKRAHPEEPEMLPTLLKRPRRFRKLHFFQVLLVREVAS